jgi:hypothetical protein
MGFGLVGKSASTAGRAKIIIATAMAVAMRRFNGIDGHATDRIDGVGKLQGLIHDAEPSNAKLANAVRLETHTR